MKPFLLLSHRPEDIEAQRELQGVIRYARIDSQQIVQYRLDQQPLGEVNLDDWSGIMIAGGPFNISDEEKPRAQLEIEHDLIDLTRRCLDADFPYLGLCYGMGLLAHTAGGIVDRTYGEEPSAPWIARTKAGDADPLFADIPELFRAFTGHKEAVTTLPREAVCLASSQHGPTQAMRIGEHVYAVQFHPELNGRSLAQRLVVYQDFGYFPAGEVDDLVAWAQTAQVGGAAHRIISNFVKLHEHR